MSSGSSGAESSASDAADALDADDPLIGRVLDGRYRIDAVLGTGGVGVVYRGEHTALRRPVAIKVLHGHFGDNDDLKRRFEREAQALSALQHPNVVAIADYGIADGMPYLSMELLEGRTLGELLDDEGMLEPGRALDIARSVLRGLAFAHARGVLHRDLKPANVFLQSLPDDPYHVKLLDFGLAKMVSDETDEGEPTLTGMGTILGTPTYMSPEQASGSRADMRSDVYSAGVLLFELLCGRPPFVATTRPEVMRAHMVEPVPRLAEARPALEPSLELQALVDRALAKEPGDRFDDGGVMLAALDELPKPAATLREEDRGSGTVRRPEDATSSAETLASSPVAAGRTGGGAAEPDSPAPAAGRRRGPLLAAGAVVALGTVGLAVALAVGGEAEEPGAEAAVAKAAQTPPTGPSSGEGDGEGAAGAGEGSGESGEGAAGEGATEGDGPAAAPDAGAAAASTEAGEGTAALGGDDAGAAATGEDAGAAASGDAGDDGIETVRSQPPSRDPFDEPLRGMLRIYKAGIDRGRTLSRAHQRKLRDYQREHPDDPRPSLLLARDFFNREWFSDAITRYRTAWQIDQSVRGDQRMLRDLIRITANEAVGDKAADTIIRIYGEEALPLLDRMLRTAPDPTAKRRLEKLRARITS